MKRIAIYGAGGFGREVQSLIEHINQVENQYEFIGFFDDNIGKGIKINDFTVLGGILDLNNYNFPLCISIAIGDPNTKKNIYNKLNNKNLSFPTLIHPTVLIGNRSFTEIGIGCIICAGVILTVNIRIEDFVILNLSCTVGHDTIIHKFSSFMPTVNISGEVIIGECVYVGTGAKIINRLAIGDNAIIGAGAVVAASIPKNATAVGVPARVIKIREK